MFHLLDNWIAWIGEINSDEVPVREFSDYGLHIDQRPNSDKGWLLLPRAWYGQGDKFQILTGYYTRGTFGFIQHARILVRHLFRGAEEAIQERVRKINLA